MKEIGFMHLSLFDWRRLEQENIDMSESEVVINASGVAGDKKIT